MSDGPKVLYLDIETAPIDLYSWGLFKQNHNIYQIIEPGRVLGVGVMWAGQKVRWLGENNVGHEAMILKVHQLLDEADIVIHYNGDSFDIKELNREFIQAGLKPPANYKTIDLMKAVKKIMRLPSYKLDYVCRIFGLETKMHNSGFEMWVKCLQNDPAGWREMARYCRQDVRIMEPLYQLLLPWIPAHPHMGLYIDAEHPVCPRCKSEHMQRRGTAVVRNYTYPRFQCQDCGGWSKGSKRERAVEGSPL